MARLRVTMIWVTSQLRLVASFIEIADCRHALRAVMEILPRVKMRAEGGYGESIHMLALHCEFITTKQKGSERNTRRDFEETLNERNDEMAGKNNLSGLTGFRQLRV